MPATQTTQEVTTEDLRRTLSEALGPRYHVTVTSDSSLKVGRTGVIPAKVTLVRTHGVTTFKVHSTGLIVSRLIQVFSINPRVRRALDEAYPGSPA